MIKTRNELLAINRHFAEHVLAMQESRYAPTSEWEEGDVTVLPDSDDFVTLNQEQADALNAEERDHYESQKDTFGVENFDGASYDKRWIGRVTLVSNEEETDAYLTDVAHLLENLRLAMNQDSLLIIPDWPTAWLYQDHDYEPVVEALAYLRARVDDTFNGGFVLKGEELIEFIPHLFWLTRCNAELPYFAMGFDKAKIHMSFCKYGVLHFEFFDAEEQAVILGFYEKAGFTEVPACFDPIDYDAKYE